MPPATEIPPGTLFDSWTVLHECLPRTHHRRFMCRCECGTEKPVLLTLLLKGESRRCFACGVKHRTLHGGCQGNTMTPEYRCWTAMKSRCECPSVSNYHLYGGRGIIVCERWQSFEAFLTDMGSRPSPKHSLDRYPDQNGNYEPNNVRWATTKEQGRNRGNNLVIEYQGRRQTLPDWAEEVGIPYGTIQARFRLGWTVEEALSIPVGARKRYGRRITVNGESLSV